MKDKDIISPQFKKEVERFIREERALLLRLAQDAVERLNDPTDSIISSAELRRRLKKRQKAK